jgi:hypothetical protein
MMNRQPDQQGMTKRGNVRGVAPISTLTRAEAYALFDVLPPAVRAAMHEAVMNWCSGWVAQSHRRNVRDFGLVTADSWTVEHIRNTDAQERRRFANDYEARYGTPYPASAARSTIQRYEQRQ